jgi:hypothetical protein
MTFTQALYKLIVLGLTAAAIITLLVWIIRPAPAHRTNITPSTSSLCTVAAANQLANYWNTQIANATYEDLQNVYIEAEKATDARLNYCKAHS